MSQDGVVIYLCNGQFYVDVNGFIVNDFFDNLIGYMVDVCGVIVLMIFMVIQILIFFIVLQLIGIIFDGVFVVFNLDLIKNVLFIVWMLLSGMDMLEINIYNYFIVLIFFDSLGNVYMMMMYFVKSILIVVEVVVILLVIGVWDVYY